MKPGGGAGKSLITKIQNLQDQASKLALPRDLQQKTPRQRQNLLGWMSVSQEIMRATHLQTYKILNIGKPAELNELMPMNTNGLRMTEHKKLDRKPKWLNKTKLTRATFRSRAYTYNTLPKEVTKQPTVKKFKKSLKTYMRKI